MHCRPVGIGRRAPGKVLRLITPIGCAAIRTPVRSLNLKPQLPLPDLQPSYWPRQGRSGRGVQHRLAVRPDQLPLKDILALVQETYTGNVGSEYMHITNTEEKRWIQQRVNPTGQAGAGRRSAAGYCRC